MSVCVYVCIVHMFGFEILYYECNSDVFNGKFEYVSGYFSMTLF